MLLHTAFVASFQWTCERAHKPLPETFFLHVPHVFFVCQYLCQQKSCYQCRLTIAWVKVFCIDSEQIFQNITLCATCQFYSSKECTCFCCPPLPLIQAKLLFCAVFHIKVLSRNWKSLAVLVLNTDRCFAQNKGIFFFHRFLTKQRLDGSPVLQKLTTAQTTLEYNKETPD